MLISPKKKTLFIYLTIFTCQKVANQIEDLKIARKPDSNYFLHCNPKHVLYGLCSLSLSIPQDRDGPWKSNCSPSFHGCRSCSFYDFHVIFKGNYDSIGNTATDFTNVLPSRSQKKNSCTENKYQRPFLNPATRIYLFQVTSGQINQCHKLAILYSERISLLHFKPETGLLAL